MRPGCARRGLRAAAGIVTRAAPDGGGAMSVGRNEENASYQIERQRNRAHLGGHGKNKTLPSTWRKRRAGCVRRGLYSIRSCAYQTYVSRSDMGAGLDVIVAQRGEAVNGSGARRRVGETERNAKTKNHAPIAAVIFFAAFSNETPIRPIIQALSRRFAELNRFRGRVRFSHLSLRLRYGIFLRLSRKRYGQLSQSIHYPPFRWGICGMPRGVSADFVSCICGGIILKEKFRYIFCSSGGICWS